MIELYIRQLLKIYKKYIRHRDEDGKRFNIYYYPIIAIYSVIFDKFTDHIKDGKCNCLWRSS